MKKQLLSIMGLILIVIIPTTCLSQVTRDLNNGLATDYVGWDVNQGFPLTIKHEAQQPINFYTFAGAGTLSNLRMFIEGNTGRVGIGNFANANTLLHVHETAANTAAEISISNNTTGNTTLDGFRMGAFADNSVMFRLYEDARIDFGTDITNTANNKMRFRIFHGTVTGNTEVLGRVGIAERNANWGTNAPIALLHMGEGWPSGAGGHRPWMDVGVFQNCATDMMYIGLKNEQNFPTILRSDRMDAIIGWGDNQTLVDNFNDLRFIFTSPIALGGVSGSADGRETMRLSWNGNVGVGNFYDPANPLNPVRPARRFEVLGDGGTTTDPQFRLTFAQPTATQIGRYTEFNSTTNGDLIISPISQSTAGIITQRRVGINTITPGNTLSIQSTAIGNSGLQFNNLTSTFIPTFASNGKVLTVDASGNVVMTNDLGGNFNSCGGSSALNHIMKYSNNTGTLGCEAFMQEDANGFVGMGMAPMTNQGLSISTNTSGFNRGISVATNSTTDNTMGVSIYPSAFRDFQAGTYVSSSTNGSSASSSQAFGHWVYLRGDNFNNIGVYANINGGANTQENYGVLARVTGAQNNSNGVSPKNFGVNAEGSGVDAVDNFGVWSRGMFGINATGVYGYGLNGTEVNLGVDGEAYGSDVTDNYGVRGRALTPGNNNYGVYGYSRAGTNNYGVWGKVETWGTINYGVYGEANLGNCGSGACFDAAGYFNGDLYYSGGLFNSSDSKLKTKIQPLFDATSILSQLQVKTYEFDTVTYPALNLKSGLNYGLIAQDVEQILPSFVKSFRQPELLDSLGNSISASVDFKAISYESFIPLLIKGFQEQKNKIDSLLAVINSTSIPKTNPGYYQDNNSNAIQRIELSNKRGIILNQNEPNPYTESTTIRFTIPEEVKEAKIIFTSIPGSVINTATINERGEGLLEVYSSELSKGLYNYTLICDGKIISTMKMVKQ
jgi:hypothetical protein